MAGFLPLAIIGQGCVLPGAHDTGALAARVFAAADLVTNAPESRLGVPGLDVRGVGPDRAVSLAGGYVVGFEETWTPDGLLLDGALLGAVDPLVRWLLHAGRDALIEAGFTPGDAALRRAGAIFGNLGFPSEAMSARAEQAALRAAGFPFRASPTHALDAFPFGLPADLVARGLGLGGPSLSLDAACASSLQAIQLAGDALQTGRADFMLAGAVQRADTLFLHIGFTALGAMSPSGRSRPFHRDADGLVPAEGAGFVLLQRLDDALRDGRRILGVVRGVGTSNDGRARSLLAPSSAGQARALRAAWGAAGFAPAEAQYVECHATGTPTGDRTELSTLVEVFGEARPALGSFKSQVGHLITAAGVAGLQKVLAGFAQEQFPLTLHTDAPIDELGAGGWSVVGAPCDWPLGARGVRTAAVSAFGFGGNNAHVVVDSAAPPLKKGARPTPPRPATTPLVVVGLAAQAGDRTGLEALGGPAAVASRVLLPLAEVRFPPNDLRAALPQQTLALALAREAVTRLPSLPSPHRVGVYVGGGCDPRIAAWGLRWRMEAHTALVGAALDHARDAAAPALRAEHVLGTMPNIPANRVNVQLDAGGPGFVLAGEELSGVHALRAAADALHAGRLDAALVGAVDVGGDFRTGEGSAGDAGVFLVVTTETQAKARGWTALGTVEPPVIEGPPASAGAIVPSRSPAHAAEALLAVARALVAPTPGTRTVRARAMGGSGASVVVNGVGVAALQGVLAAAAGGPASDPVLELVVHPVESPLATPMAPAPTLPRVGTRPSGVRVRGDEGLAQRHRATEKTRQRATPTPPVEPPPAVATTLRIAEGAGTSAHPLLAAFQAQRQAVVDAHRAWIHTMAVTHDAWLRARVGGAAPVAAANVWELAATPVSSLTHVSVVSSRETSVAPVPIPPSALAPAPPVETASDSSASRRVACAPDETRTPGEPASVPSKATPYPLKPLGSHLPSFPDAASLPGPRLDRHMLECISVGPLSVAFGPEFASQDAYARVVRMPAAPLLLCDRVLGISGDPLVQGRGSIWTETDVGSAPHAWALHDGHLRGGVFIEAGQADLLLASWQGMDVQHNRGERVYRLLGCELTYRGPLPADGETLRYDIHLDGHARLGDVRMFFFHYDCRVADAARLTVRNGQAGFFTDAELAASGGILWDPVANADEVDVSGPLDAPVVPNVPSALDEAALQAFARRNLATAFGGSGGNADDWRLAASHTRSPSIAGGDQLLLHRVTHLDPRGGPWQRGYLRAEWDVSPEDWFFRGHFHGDPCMPGTLMFDGCLHAMSVYLAAQGMTLARDGWRFEPAQDVPFQLRCRGQVIPTSRQLVYEIFVQELVAGDLAAGVRPRVKAQVLCTVDGLKCFHADPLVLELVPDWPMQRLGRGAAPATPPLRSDPDSRGACPSAEVLAAAFGRPTDAFGSSVARFDAGIPLPRLPGPPYLCISRIAAVTPDARDSLRAGAEVVAELDLADVAWAFEESGHGRLPWSLLLETALQPCGWLASHVGCAAASSGTVLFRNLDGEGTVHAEVAYDGGPLRTRARLTRLSRSAGMTLVHFDVVVEQAGAAVYTVSTGFGFFPPASFAQQAGVGSTDAERAAIALPGNEIVALRGRTDATLPQPHGRLGLLDRVVERSPAGGAQGLGRWRAEIDVDPAAWFFKAHFFQDPVQPGSLGLDALQALLQYALADAWVERTAGATAEARLVAFTPGAAHRWRYRGQVRPENRLVQVEIDVTSRSQDGRRWTADGHLWVDGLRIYSAWGLACEVAPSKVAPVRAPVPEKESAPGPQAVAPELAHDRARPFMALPIGTAPVHGPGGDYRPDPTPVTGVDDATVVTVEPTTPAFIAEWTEPTVPVVGVVLDAVAETAPPAPPAVWPFAPREEADRSASARVGTRLGIAPDKVQFAGGRGWATERPLRVFPVNAETQLVGLPRVDVEPVLSWWRVRAGVDGWLGEPLMHALLRTFVSDLVLHDPAGLLALRGRPVLLLANHQNYLESALLTTLLAPILGSPIRSVAKTAHKGGWLEQLANLYTRYPNAPVTERIVWFDPNDRASLVALAQEAVDRPLLVHVEGTRQTEPDQTIEKFSSIWLDLAMQRELPILPVAFRGGVTGAGTRHEVPPAAQIHHVGAPILPATLASLPHAERRPYVARAIDALGRPEALSDGSVRAPGAAFTAALRTWAPDLLRLTANPPSGPTYAWLRQLQQLLRAGEG